MQAIPKSDVRIVLAVVVVLISWLLHIIQYQKYERVVKYLRTATLNNLGPKNGGTKQTVELYKRAAELYETRVKESE